MEADANTAHMLRFVACIPESRVPSYFWDLQEARSNKREGGNTMQGATNTWTYKALLYAKPAGVSSRKYQA